MLFNRRFWSTRFGLIKFYSYGYLGGGKFIGLEYTVCEYM